jgi:hypothetical protein
MGRNEKGQFIKGQRAWNKGKPASEIAKKRLSKSHMGQKAWNKGKPYLAIRGKKHYRWHGGFWINKAGYKILEIKRLGKVIRIREHRYVMEQHLGRKLRKGEDVHHIDGNKLNNNISNLQVLSKSDHTKLHHRWR